MFGIYRLEKNKCPLLLLLIVLLYYKLKEKNQEDKKTKPRLKIKYKVN